MRIGRKKGEGRSWDSAEVLPSSSSFPYFRLIAAEAQCKARQAKQQNARREESVTLFLRAFLPPSLLPGTGVDLFETKRRRRRDRGSRRRRSQQKKQEESVHVYNTRPYKEARRAGPAPLQRRGRGKKGLKPPRAPSLLPPPPIFGRRRNGPCPSCSSSSILPHII